MASELREQPAVLSLPLPLLLLINLHILNFPYANNSEYDRSLFDPRVRGLRERTKSMEDICYFLVGIIEPGKGRNKAILPMYPCLQPSDTVAFRNVIVKYIEALRHDALYPDAKSKAGVGGTRTKIDSKVAWWWKDVVVRKSLLEECSGERFERLIVSFATHTLLKTIPTSFLANVTPQNTNELFRSLPETYITRLDKFKSEKDIWLRSASLLLQRQTDLKRLRDHVERHDDRTSSKYHTLSTERLSAFCDAKFRDLLNDYWHGDEGLSALNLLKELAGLTPTPSPFVQATFNPKSTDPLRHKQTNTQTPVVPPSLLVAAAHHPSHIRKLGKSIFSSPKGKFPVLSQSKDGDPAWVTEPKTHASIALSGQLDAEKRMGQALADALRRAKKANEELKPTIERVKEVVKCPEQVKMDLWEGGGSSMDGKVNFETPPTPSLLSEFSLNTTPRGEALEARIDYIRASVLTAFPDIPPVVSETLVTSETHLDTRERPCTPENHYGMSTQVDEKHQAKPTQRKSIRQSLALAHRPVLFDAPSSLDAEVYRIAEAVEDHDDENSSDGDRYNVLTPRAKVIGTRLTPAAATLTKRTHLFENRVPSRTRNVEWSDDVRLLGSDAGDEDDDGWLEGPSMTLRDILLDARDSMQLEDLLNDDHDGLSDESLDWE